MPGMVTSRIARVLIDCGAAHASAKALGPPPVVSDQVKTPEVEPLAHFPEVRRDGLLVVPVLRPRAFSQPGQVRGDNPVASGKPGDELAPFVPGLRPAVQQHHGDPRARGDDVQRYAREAECPVLQSRIYGSRQKFPTRCAGPRL